MIREPDLVNVRDGFLYLMMSELLKLNKIILNKRLRNQDYKKEYKKASLLKETILFYMKKKEVINDVKR